MAGADYTVYGQRRRRRWAYFAGAAVCVLAALAAWQIIGVPGVSAVTPGPDAFVSDPSLPIVLNVKGLGGLEDVRVTLDGDDVTDVTTRNGDTLTFTPSGLADGDHRVTFSAASSNLLRRDVQEDWVFTVDTSVPKLKLNGSAEKGRINTSPAVFSGATEAHATVTVTDGTAKAAAVAGVNGKFSVSAQLPDGPSNVTVTTTDRAGNSTAETLDVYVDAVPPELTASEIPKRKRNAKIQLRIEASDQLGPPRLTVALDGEERRAKKQASSMIFKVEDLAEGRHVVIVTASDKGGNVVTDKQTFVVDSTERFGSKAMWLGARGKDVKALQKRLDDAGVLEGKQSGVYDERTEAAVKDYQGTYGFTADGRVDGDTLTALGGQIVVDLGDRQLYLYRGDKLFRSYGIAVGQPAYPTPTGSCVIVNKQVDPTWIPPDSDWAKDAKPIPPGPDNPLGTRWIGTSFSGIGIHGTPDGWSIGTYASHGCIRMHIPDVEDLYTHVVVGMPVLIQL